MSSHEHSTKRAQEKNLWESKHEAFSNDKESIRFGAAEKDEASGCES